MEFSYVGYAEDRSVVSGKVSAPSEDLARQILSRSRYRVLSLKPSTPFMPTWGNLFPSFFGIKLEVIIMLARQLALLLESGTDIVTALELLQAQSTNSTLKKVMSEVVSDLRNGNKLSSALAKHPKVFPNMFIQSLVVGEQSGGLEKVLRQMANYLEKENIANKATKNALKYPLFVSLLSVAVIIVMLTFVFPAFAGLYSSMGADLPFLTAMLLAVSNGLKANGLYILIVVAGVVAGIAMYVRSPGGKAKWDSTFIRLPLLGRVAHMNELSRCCRSISMLIGAGLPLPQIMSLVIESSENTAIKKALDQVREDMMKGEGLSRPMSKSSIFMPMMVQMARVGERTGNLDVTLQSVADSYEAEAQERTKALIGMIQPLTTIIIAGIVGTIALSLVSVMYSIYGQV
ncbi:MAG: type II secretion system F family protein [Chloroflexi bacterium]|nr:type II secretion system F family protein [Chloroflexota bacterium]